MQTTIEGRLEPLAFDDAGLCKRPSIFSTQSPFGRCTHNLWWAKTATNGGEPAYHHNSMPN